MKDTTKISIAILIVMLSLLVLLIKTLKPCFLDHGAEGEEIGVETIFHNHTH